MTRLSDLLPQPPWEGPPLPRALSPGWTAREGDRVRITEQGSFRGREGIVIRVEPGLFKTIYQIQIDNEIWPGIWYSGDFEVLRG